MTSAADKSLGNEVVKNLVLKVNKDNEVKTGCREVPEDAGQSRIRILGLLSPEYPCKETSATLRTAEPDWDSRKPAQQRAASAQRAKKP